MVSHGSDAWRNARKQRQAYYIGFSFLDRLAAVRGLICCKFAPSGLHLDSQKKPALIVNTTTSFLETASLKPYALACQRGVFVHACLSYAALRMSGCAGRKSLCGAFEFNCSVLSDLWSNRAETKRLGEAR